MNTIVIAQVLGIFFAITGISMVANSKGTENAIEASIQNKGSLFIWGIVSLLVGATVVVLNNMWISGLSLFIAILGWVALLKGTFILIFPNAAVSFYGKFNKRSLLVFGGLVAVVLGLMLLSWQP